MNVCLNYLSLEYLNKMFFTTITESLFNLPTGMFESPVHPSQKTRKYKKMIKKNHKNHKKQKKTD